MKLKSRQLVKIVVLMVAIQAVIPIQRGYAAPLHESAAALALPGGEQGQTYEYRFEAEGGTSPVTWRVSSGELPPGLTLDHSGKLSGTPAGSRLEPYAFEIEVSDSSRPPQTVAQPYLLQIKSAPLRIKPATAKLKLVSPRETATNSTPLPDENVTRNFKQSPTNQDSNVSSSSPANSLSAKESAQANGGGTEAGNPFGRLEYDPARVVRIFEDTKRGDRYLIYEPNQQDTSSARKKSPQLGEIVARRYKHKDENRTHTLVTQLAVDVDSTIVIEPIPDAFTRDMPLNKLFMRASLKKADKTNPVEVKNYAEIAKDQKTMAAQQAVAFKTARDVQSTILNLAFTAEDTLMYAYEKCEDEINQMDLHDKRAKEIEDSKEFKKRLSERLHFYKPSEFTAITNFLLDERNLNVVEVIGNDVFWIDAASLQLIAKQLQDNFAKAFDATNGEDVKNKALLEILERVKLIHDDLKEAREEIVRLEEMTPDQLRAYCRMGDKSSVDPNPKPLSIHQQKLLELLIERGQQGPGKPRGLCAQKSPVDDLIEQTATLVYTEHRADIALSYLKKLFTPGQVSLENAGAEDGNLLTLSIEMRGSDTDKGGAGVDFEVAIRKFGVKLQLGSTMMFLNRKGVSNDDGSKLKPVNYAPSPGMNFGFTYFKRGESPFDKLLRALAPTFGVNVSFMNFNDPGFDQLKQQFTNTTGSNVQVGAGPVVSFFNNKIDVTTGWNLNVDRKRRYFGFGFGFIEIAKFLKDKVKAN